MRTKKPDKEIDSMQELTEKVSNNRYERIYKTLQRLREHPHVFQQVLKTIGISELDYIEIVWCLADKCNGLEGLQRVYIPLKEGDSTSQQN